MDLSGITFWLYLLFFPLVISIAFLIPGDLIISKLKLTFFQRITLGTVFGMVMWGWQGYIFGYLGLRFLSYYYLLFTLFLWLRLNYRFFNISLIKKVKTFKPDRFQFLLIFIGVIVQVLTIWFTGIKVGGDLYFCCGNVGDNIFHISLTNQLVKQFPPMEPGMSGVEVKNYHYWGNLVVSDLIRVFRLPLMPTIFQFFLPFISLFLGLSAITFAQLNKLNRMFIRWLLFFLYFGGDLIFLLLIVLGKGLVFNMTSLEDGAKFLANPPRAFSIVVFFAGMSLFSLWIRKRDYYSGFLSAFVLGGIIGFKVYTGLFALIGLFFAGTFYLVKKDFRVITFFLLASLLSLIIYLPVNKNAGGLYFTGFWIFENFITQPSLGLQNIAMAQSIYYEHHNWARIIINDLIFAPLFIISIFSTKLIGLFQNKKSLFLLPLPLNIFLISGLLFSALFGFFFQQTTGGANTFNFLILVYIIGSIYTALSLTYWLERIKFNKLRMLLIFMIVFLTIPRVINESVRNASDLLSFRGAIISKEQLEGLDYLRERSDKNSLILVNHKFLAFDAYTPYVSFLADRAMYLAGEKEALATHGVNFTEREKTASRVLYTYNIASVSASLIKSNTDYVFTSSSDKLVSTPSASFFKMVYQNSKVMVLKVNKEEVRKYVDSTIRE